MGSKMLCFCKKRHWKLLKFSKYWTSFDSFCKIDGFDNLFLKIDGFHGTHRTHANGAPAPLVCMPCCLAWIIYWVMYNNTIQALLAIDTMVWKMVKQQKNIWFLSLYSLLRFSTKQFKENVKMIVFMKFCNLENGAFQRQIACFLRRFRSVFFKVVFLIFQRTV